MSRGTTNQRYPIRPEVWLLTSLDEDNDRALGVDVSVIVSLFCPEPRAKRESLRSPRGAAALFIAWEDDSQNPGVPDISYNFSINQGLTFEFSRFHNISFMLSLCPNHPDWLWLARPSFSFGRINRLETTSSPFGPSHSAMAEFDPASIQWPYGSSHRQPPEFDSAKHREDWFEGVRRVGENETPNDPNVQEVMFMSTTIPDGVVPINLSLTQLAASDSPSVAVDGSDVYVVWSDNQGVQSDIFFLVSYDSW